MKTSDLIAALATDAGPTRRALVTRNLSLGVGLGMCASLVVLVFWLGVQNLSHAMGLGAFWMKAGYTLSLAIAGFLCVRRLARPGGAPGLAPWVALAAFSVMLVLATFELVTARPEQVTALWMGHTLPMCPLRILALAIPIYLGLAPALRRLAPTRLALTGAAAGLLAGGAGATVYGLFCNESAATFVAAWYTVGIALCAGLGAMVGQRMLRW